MSADNTKSLLAQRLAERRAALGTIPPAEPPKPPTFREYVEHDWALTPIKDGQKAPRGDRWNTRENAITDPERAKHLVNAGLLHAYSGTCAIDVDAIDLARVWFKDRGVDLDTLFSAPDAVQIVRGDANRGKLLYSLPEPLPTKKIAPDDITVVEFRCGATTGNSQQDVLPPSRHPKGELYRWAGAGDWRRLPLLPKPLHDLWLSMVSPKIERARIELEPSAETSELRKLIANKDPDVPYDEWCKVGMILHHETRGSDDGLTIWNDWSMRGAKYVGIEDLESHWNSFGNAASPATAGSLRREQVASDEDFGPPARQRDDLLGDAERVQFKLIALGEFAKREPVRYLVDELIEVGQLFGFIGKRKSGKSYAALDLAFAVAQGRPWARHAVNEPGPVVWIAAEGARSLEIRRGPQWLAHHGPADIRVWPHALNLRREETYRGLVEACRGVRLVVIDSLRRVTPGAKENSSDELAEVLAYAEQLTRETGATVGFIAHAGKGKNEGDATTARGSSVIEDQLEAGFGVEKLEGEHAGKFRLTPAFARDEETGADVAMHFALREIAPEGLTPGVIVNWDVDAPRKDSGKQTTPDWRALTDEVITQLGSAFTRKQVHDAATKLANERFDAFTEPTLKRGVNRALEERQHGKDRTLKAAAWETRGKTTSATEFELLPVASNPDRAHVERLLATDPDSDLLGDANE